MKTKMFWTAFAVMLLIGCLLPVFSSNGDTVGLSGPSKESFPPSPAKGNVYIQTSDDYADVILELEVFIPVVGELARNDPEITNPDVLSGSFFKETFFFRQVPQKQKDSYRTHGSKGGSSSWGEREDGKMMNHRAHEIGEWSWGEKGLSIPVVLTWQYEKAAGKAKETLIIPFDSFGLGQVGQMHFSYAWDESPLPPLMRAVINRKRGEVKRLVKAGADVNQKDDKQRTPLMMAAVDYRSLDIVEYLLSVGADINARDESGRTPLFYPATWGSLDRVKYLVSKGADINAVDNDGNNLLMTTVEPGDMTGGSRSLNMDLVEYLVEQGFDLNAKNRHGETALTIAIRSGNKDIIEFLRQHGARE